MTLIQVNGVYVNEDLYKFPDPDLVIQSVSNKSDLNLLGSKNMSSSNGFVYFYIDKDWHNNTVNYVGETKNSLQYRHTSTHAKKDWFANLKYPLIGIAQSPYRAWDTDTRRVIESLVLQQLKNAGLTPANSENSTWMNFDISGHPEQHYLEKIATMIVEYQLAHLGVRTNTLVEFKNTQDLAILEIQKVAESVVPQIIPAASIPINKKDLTPKGIWIKPIEGRRIIAKSRGCTVRGYQTSNSLVVITEALNIPRSTRPSANDSTVNLHTVLLSEAIPDKNGEYNWQGNSGPQKITKYLSGFFGAETANIWKEDVIIEVL